MQHVQKLSVLPHSLPDSVPPVHPAKAQIYLHKDNPLNPPVYTQPPLVHLFSHTNSTPQHDAILHPRHRRFPPRPRCHRCTTGAWSTRLGSIPNASLHWHERSGQWRCCHREARRAARTLSVRGRKGLLGAVYGRAMRGREVACGLRSVRRGCRRGWGRWKRAWEGDIGDRVGFGVVVGWLTEGIVVRQNVVVN